MYNAYHIGIYYVANSEVKYYIIVWNYFIYSYLQIPKKSFDNFGSVIL